MKKMIMTWLCVSLFSFCSCQKDLIEYEAGDIKVCIEEGDEWLHDFLRNQKEKPTSDCNLDGRYEW